MIKAQAETVSELLIVANNVSLLIGFPAVMRFPPDISRSLAGAARRTPDFQLAPFLYVRTAMGRPIEISALPEFYRARA